MAETKLTRTHLWRKTDTLAERKWKEREARYHTLLQCREWAIIPLTGDEERFIEEHEREIQVRAKLRDLKLEKAAKKAGKRLEQLSRGEVRAALGANVEASEKPRPKPRARRGNGRSLQEREESAHQAAAVLRHHEETRDRSEAVLNARILAMACLPKRSTKATEVQRVVRMGADTWARVVIQAESGLMPFGQDRIPMVAIFTRAVRNGSPLVEFSSTLEVLRDFNIESGGRQYTRFRDGFRRLAGCGIRIYYGRTEAEVRAGNMGERLDFIDAWNLPSDQDLAHESMGMIRLPFGPSGFRVKLSERFWEHICKRENQALAPIEIMRRYQDEPAAWDFAWFVITRCRRAETLSSVPHDALMDMFRDGKEEDRNVIRRLASYLEDIQKATDGRLNAWLEEAEPLRDGEGGRPKKRWVLKVGKSRDLVWSGNRR